MVVKENSIAAKLAKIVAGALQTLGVTGYAVLAGNQPTPKGRRDPYILISRVASRRVGWQGTHYIPTTSGGLQEEWSYIEDATYQISGYRPQETLDGVDTETSSDVVNALATYFMSDMGIAAFRAEGFHQYRIWDVRLPVSRDENGIPEFNPNFDVVFCIHQTAHVAVPPLYFGEIKTVGV